MLIAVTRVSPYSGKTNTLNLDITEAQLTEWMLGKTAQEAFPNLNADHREFIMTGLTPEEWEELFGDERDYD